MNDVTRGLVLTQLGNGLLRRLFTSYVHEPNFRTHFCRSNGKYCTSIGQVLVKEAGQNQLHLPVLDRITGVLYLSVPPLNSLSALQVVIRTLRMKVVFLMENVTSKLSRSSSSSSSVLFTLEFTEWRYCQ